MKKYTETINGIQRVVDWYKKEGLDSVDRIMLSKARSRLACWNWNLATIILDVRNETATFKHLNKVGKAKKIVELKNENNTDVFSENKAIVENEQLYMNEIQGEGLAKGLNLLWDSSNSVQNSIASQLKVLEDEEKKSKSQV